MSEGFAIQRRVSDSHAERVDFLTKCCERFCDAAIILTSRLAVGDSLTVGMDAVFRGRMRRVFLAATALVSEFLSRFLQVGFQRV